MSDDILHMLSDDIRQAQYLIVTRRWNEIYERLVTIWRRIVQAIVRIWQPIGARLLYLRRHGTHAQKQVAWKLLHSPRMRRVKVRLAR
jgi:hypothetical protein